MTVRIAKATSNCYSPPPLTLLSRFVGLPRSGMDFGGYLAVERGRRKGKSSPARSPGQGRSPAGVERSESLDAGEHRGRIKCAGKVYIKATQRRTFDFADTGEHHASMELLERITIDAEKCGGRPCIRGMRIRVTDILESLAGGATQEDILCDYPYLEPDDIKAALVYTARQRNALG